MLDKSLADNIFIVLCAYAAAFLPWTAFAATDFINPVWKSVATTRREGIYNLVFTIVPATYITFYIALQAHAVDYKEMCAAALALIFSLLHFCRTVWGLWQLACFRSWAANSIRNLRKLGIRYRPLEGNPWESPDALSDHMLVNESIVDNQILHGEARCYLQYGDMSFRLDKKGGSFLLQRARLMFLILLLPLRFGYDLVRTRVTRKPCPTLHQVPHEPVDVWLNWSVAFASQGLRQWIEDFQVADDPDVIHAEQTITNLELYKKRRDYFAGEVLASAGLHLWPHEYDRATSPMLWSEWAEDSDISDGRVTKAELLRQAIRSGKGLPFGSPQHDVAGAYQRDEQGKIHDRGYYSYSRKLVRVTESMPPAFGDVIEQFDISRLEWLTILLCMGALASESGTDDTDKDDEIGWDQAPSSDGGNSFEGSDSGSEDLDSLDARDLAVETLCLQLGFEPEQTTVSSERTLRGLCAFLLPAEGLNKVSASNRLAMKSGELIDAWLALESGKQISFLLSFGEAWEDYCLSAETTGQERVEQTMNSQDVSRLGTSSSNEAAFPLPELERLWKAQGAVEKARLDYQFGKMYQRYWHLEPTITFMGYGMEVVRTHLALWRNSHPELDPGSWSPKFAVIARQDGARVSDQVHIGRLSSELSEQLSTLNLLRRRSFQTRLLWEVQKSLGGRVEGNNKGPGSLELVILSIVSFPALVFEIETIEPPVERISGARGDSSTLISFGSCLKSSTTTPDLSRKFSQHRVILRPKCGPQCIDVELSMKYSIRRLVTVSACLRVRSTDAVACFRWQLWRDAFLARLEALAMWQKAHELRSVELVITRKGIEEPVIDVYPHLTSSDKPFHAWSGWSPFRPGICRFELESPEFLREYQDTRDLQLVLDKTENWTTYHELRQKEYRPVEYTVARREQLMHFCFTVREADHTQSTASKRSRNESGNLLLTQANDLISRGAAHMSRAALLLELAVIEFENLEAIPVYLELMTRDKSRLKNPGRAVALLELCVSNAMKGTEPQAGRQSVNGAQLSNFLQWFRDLSEREQFSEDVAVSTLDFLRMIPFIDRKLDSESFLFFMHQLFFYTRQWRCLTEFGLVLQSNAFVSRIQSRTNQYSRRAADDQFRDTREVERALNRLRKACFDRAATEGQNGSARVELALLLQYGAVGVDKDGPRAKLLNELASKENGNSSAMNNLGWMLQHGATGVVQDAKKAKEMYEQAVDEGHTDAMIHLGWLLEQGAAGVERDPPRAQEIYERAIREGRHVMGMNNLAVMLESGEPGVLRDAPRAKQLYELAISEGRYVKSMVNLGLLLESGAPGVEKDVPRAKALYEQAISEWNDIGAMIRMALLLQDGAPGVERNVTEARDLLERAANEGSNAYAMTKLGQMLQNGAPGVNAKPAQAVEWFTRTIELGTDNLPSRSVATFELGKILEKGAPGVERNVARAVELYEMAVREDANEDAMERLEGLLTVGSDGIDPNPALLEELRALVLETTSE